MVALLLGLCVEAGCCAPAVAQEQATATFHVYANRIQIPVLVLSSERKRIKQSVAERLSLSIDSGPSFRPDHVRREGDDPISLSILIDTGRPQERLLGKIGAAIGELAPSSLSIRDRISIYALGCHFVRTLDDAPAEHMQLQEASARALVASGARSRSSQKDPCEQDVHLWDALSFVTNDLSRRPGRRVILVVSNGRDEGSTRKWNDLRTYAQNSSVAIFGLTCMADFRSCAGGSVPSVEDLFVTLCELSGGTILQASAFDVGDQLKSFVTMLRDRYIVEFPRPWNATTGQHSLVVKVDKSDDYVRSAGVVVPLADPLVVNDPSTVPADLTSAPTVGVRRPMTPPQ